MTTLEKRLRYWHTLGIREYMVKLHVNADTGNITETRFPPGNCAQDPIVCGLRGNTAIPPIPPLPAEAVAD